MAKSRWYTLAARAFIASLAKAPQLANSGAFASKGPFGSTGLAVPAAGATGGSAAESVPNAQKLQRIGDDRWIK
jgi:hypothetical protein